MEPIAKTLSTYSPEWSQTLSKPLPATATQHVFDSLKGQLGAKMATLWDGIAPDLVMREWGSGLSGFRKQELQRGLDACSERQFAPTLGEFKQLCRPCLNHEWAWLEAGECLRQRDTGALGDWTHPAVFFAAAEMSPEVRGGDWMRHKTRWSRTLQRELAKGWREVPAPAMRIDHDAKVGPPPEGVRTNLNRLLEEAKRHAAAKKAEADRLDREAS